MASYTTNLNLKKPAGSENVAIGDINNNMDLIDSAYGLLNSKIAKTVTWNQSITVTPTNPLYKKANSCFLSLRFNTTAAIAAWELIGTVPSDCYPSNIVFMPIIKGGNGYLQIGADGKIYSSVALTNNTEYYIANSVWFV